MRPTSHRLKRSLPFLLCNGSSESQTRPDILGGSREVREGEEAGFRPKAPAELEGEEMGGSGLNVAQQNDRLAKAMMEALHDMRRDADELGPVLSPLSWVDRFPDSPDGAIVKFLFALNEAKDGILGRDPASAEAGHAALLGMMAHCAVESGLCSLRDALLFVLGWEGPPK